MPDSFSDCTAGPLHAAPDIRNWGRHNRRRARRQMDRPYDLYVDLVPNHVLSPALVRPDLFHLLWA
jgi:hypothetical protein